MRWAQIQHAGKPVYGIVGQDDIELVDGTPFDSSTPAPNGQRLALSAVHWLPPVIPPTFYCVGLNYTAHIEMEAKLRGQEPKFPSQPDVGYRAVNALTGHEQPIVIPADATERVQYEGELVCVVGKTAKHLTRENALDCLLGFTIGNDFSERSWQASDRTLWRAKNADTFKPMGPWIETDFDLEGAVTRVRVNGEEKIEFETNNMLFGVVDYLVAITRYITLVPGDVLWMGTEGHAENLLIGDEVEVEISGIGTLRNKLAAAS